MIGCSRKGPFCFPAGVDTVEVSSAAQGQRLPVCFMCLNHNVWHEMTRNISQVIRGTLSCRETLLLFHHRHFLRAFVKTVPSVCVCVCVLKHFILKVKKEKCFLYFWCDSCHWEENKMEQLSFCFWSLRALFDIMIFCSEIQMYCLK